jgi:hypothetical protein
MKQRKQSINHLGHRRGRAAAHVGGEWRARPEGPAPPPPPPFMFIKSATASIPHRGGRLI